MRPRSVLVIVTRRLGDVLLATPLIRSLKRARPETAIDALVFAGTEEAIAANPDVRRVRVIAARPGWLANLALVAGIVRRYDAALSLVPGDRPTLYAFLAGRWRAGLLVDSAKERWKRALLQRWIAFDDLDTHTVRMHLKLAEALAIEPCADVVVAWSGEHEREMERACPFDTRREAYAVLHPYPRFNYKMWHVSGWAELARWLAQRGLRVVLTGGGDPAEREYVGAVAAAIAGAVTDLAGKLSLPAASALISRTKVYVGPDTVTTHIAAGLGVPTVALFGPSNPVKWGPWPRGHPAGASPWRRLGSQRSGNVFLLQGRGACVPCHLEGCDRHTESYSDCLQQLPAARVIAAIEEVIK